MTKQETDGPRPRARESRHDSQSIRPMNKAQPAGLCLIFLHFLLTNVNSHGRV